MTPPSAWLRDVVAYSLQLALLVGAAALLARLLPLRPPRVALAYWQALLLACVSLPLGQPRQEPHAPPARLGVPVAGATQALQPAAAPLPIAWPSARAVILVLALGVALRGAWIAVGLWRLRGLRRSGRPLPSGLPPIQQAQALVGVGAEFYGSDATDVPITFGLRRPAVLLPEAVLAMPAATQQAIVCHELLHVRRKDWAWAVVEECAKALLWFHPAIAWLVSRIQLVREQAVDRAVVALSSSREDYVGALLAVARARPQSSLVPAPPFLRRSRLKQRVAEILEEGTMSRTRLTTNLLASGVVVALSLAAGLRLFPLEARAAASDDKPIQVLRGGENLLHGPRLEYPPRALERGVQGEVLLEVTRDERGEVQDARVLSGPDELRAAALRSVLGWHYSSAAGPGTSEVLLQFRLPAAGEPDAEELEKEQALRRLKSDIHEFEGSRFRYSTVSDEADVNRMRDKLALAQAELQAREQKQLEERAQASAEQQARLESELDQRKLRAQLERALALERKAADKAEQQARLEAELDQRKLKVQAELVQAELRKQSDLLETDAVTVQLEPDRVVTVNKIRDAARLPARLTAIHAARLAPEARQALLQQLGVSVGDMLDAAALERVRAAVARFDEHVRVEVGRAPDGGVILLLVGPQP